MQATGPLLAASGKGPFPLPLIAVMGPTGSGKTGLSEALAEELDAVLISADAFQIYRGFDIGTAKSRNPAWNLVNIREPTEAFGAGEFVRLCGPILESAFAAQRPVIVSGGTGFYIRALFEGYAEMTGEPSQELRQELMQREKAEGLSSLAEELDRRQPGHTVDRRNPVRVRRALERLLEPAPQIVPVHPPFARVKLGLSWPVESLNLRLEQRLDEMLEQGWLEEVRLILKRGTPRDAPAMRAIGYELLTDVAEGRLGLEAARSQILVLTRQYAKRQRSWMRSEPGLRMIPGEEPDLFGRAKEALALTRARRV